MRGLRQVLEIFHRKFGLMGGSKIKNLLLFGPSALLLRYMPSKQLNGVECKPNRI